MSNIKKLMSLFPRTAGERAINPWSFVEFCDVSAEDERPEYRLTKQSIVQIPGDEECTAHIQREQIATFTQEDAAGKVWRVVLE